MIATDWTRTFRARTTRLLIAIALPFLVVPAVHADYVTQSVTLDQSNTLKDGVSYGSVLIEAYNGVGAAGGGLNAGEVRLTFNASALPYTGLSKTFGIDRVAFNSDLSLKDATIAGPSGWKTTANSTVSGFGKFAFEVQGNAAGGSRPNPVTIFISGLGADATVNHFLFGSTGAGGSPPAEGAAFFALHVAGFDLGVGNSTTSQFIGGSNLVVVPPPDGGPGGSGELNPTPEPGTFVLYGLGFGAIGLVHAASRRRRRDDSVNMA